MSNFHKSFCEIQPYFAADYKLQKRVKIAVIFHIHALFNTNRPEF